MQTYDAIIIGAGPAGLTAAIYLERAGWRTLVLEEYVYGGQMANTPEVENYPALGKVSGVELSTNLYNQAVEQGATIEFDGVVSASLTAVEKSVTTQSGRVHTAPVVVIANGAKRRKLGVPGEQELAGRGVSYCATCDGGFYKGKTTVVIGGGNTAVEDALYLANICEQVHLVHRRDAFRAGKILTDALKKRENIQIHYNAVPAEILAAEGKKTVGTVRIRDVHTGETTDISAQGVFVAIGLEPDNRKFAEELDLDTAGYILSGEDCKTSQPGVFAAGDTRTKALRQIVTAAGDGAVAAFEAGNYLAAR
ncbi:MAG: thioredoxin-disulfide reductase [Anaerotruncus sp.]|nr:thioredoxin-disulfide reductase [Anaerotruncus sp.]